ATLVEYLLSLETRSWSEWGRQRKPITPVGIAKLLKDHDIKPYHWRQGEKTHRGYWVTDFQDAFERYCRISTSTPGSPVGTLGTPLESNGLPEFNSAQGADSVPTWSDCKLLKATDCAECAESIGPDDGPPSFYDREGDYDMDGNAWTSNH